MKESEDAKRIYGFSKHGNLNQTIIELINASSCGLHAKVIGELIDYAPHSLLKMHIIEFTRSIFRDENAYIKPCGSYEAQINSESKIISAPGRHS